MATGLIYREGPSANAGRILREFLLASSTEFTLLEGVKLDAKTGELILWGAGGAGLGPIVEFRKADSSPITDDGAGGDFEDTYLTPASNTVLAVVDVSTESVYSIDLDDTLETTTGSSKAGVGLDFVAASNILDENVLTNAGTTASFFSLGTDTDINAATDAVLVKIQESQWKL